MELGTLAAIFDELEKVAAKSPPRYRAGIAAHELGHAKDLESSRVPALRLAGRVLGPVAGALGGGELVKRKHPVLGGLAAFAGNVPGLADEMLASYHGMKALKHSGKFEKKELRRMRNHLAQAGGTYLSSAAATTGAALALGGKGATRAVGLGVLGGGLLGQAGLVGRISRRVGRQAAVPKAELEKLRASMGVKGQIYGKKAKGPLGELSAYYAPKPTGKITRWMTKQQLKRDVSKKDMKKILSEGGVVLPQAA